MAEQVDRHHGVPVGEQVHAGRPRVGGRAQAVEEHDGVAGAPADGVESHGCGPYPAQPASDERDHLDDGERDRAFGAGRCVEECADPDRPEGRATDLEARRHGVQRRPHRVGRAPVTNGERGHEQGRVGGTGDEEGDETDRPDAARNGRERGTDGSHAQRGAAQWSVGWAEADAGDRSADRSDRHRQYELAPGIGGASGPFGEVDGHEGDPAHRAHRHRREHRDREQPPVRADDPEDRLHRGAACRWCGGRGQRQAGESDRRQACEDDECADGRRGARDRDHGHDQELRADCGPTVRRGVPRLERRRSRRSGGQPAERAHHRRLTERHQDGCHHEQADGNRPEPEADRAEADGTDSHESCQQQRGSRRAVSAATDPWRDHDLRERRRGEEQSDRRVGDVVLTADEHPRDGGAFGDESSGAGSRHVTREL